MSNKNEQGGMDVKQKNVYDKPLHQHSNPRSLPSLSSVDETSVKTGFCNERAPVAALMTDGFLSFSASKGVDLKKQGLQPGQRLCVEVGRWKEAVDGGGDKVPKVNLACTHKSALDNFSMETLKKYEAPSAPTYDQRPGDHPNTGAVSRESSEIGGKEPKA